LRDRNNANPASIDIDKMQDLLFMLKKS
jgi:hypothetical protein